MDGDEVRAQGQRRAVRVNDRILFSYDQVPTEKFKAIAEEYAQGISYYNQAGLEDIQMHIGAQNALSRIRERDEDLGDFLQHLDGKVNLILQKVRGKSSPLDSLTSQQVNLSGSGIGFFTDRLLQKDEILSFHIVLSPANTYIYCFGKVVNCQSVEGQSENKGNYVSAQFVLILDADQEKLIQHSFKLQSLALRNRRQKDLP